MTRLKFTPEVHITRTERCTLTLGRWELVELLAAGGVTVPADATITFTVPGGGNYCGMALDIDQENPIDIQFEREVSGTPEEVEAASRNPLVDYGTQDEAEDDPVSYACAMFEVAYCRDYPNFQMDGDALRRAMEEVIPILSSVLAGRR